MVSKLSSCNSICEKARIWKLGACLMAWSCPSLTALNPDSPCAVPGVHRHNYCILQGYFFHFSVCNNVTTQLQTITVISGDKYIKRRYKYTRIQFGFKKASWFIKKNVSKIMLQYFFSVEVPEAGLIVKWEGKMFENQYIPYTYPHNNFYQNFLQQGYLLQSSMMLSTGSSVDRLGKD